ASASSTRARGKRAAAKAGRTTPVAARTRPLSAVADIGREAKGKGPPTAAQLGGALGKLYGHATVVVASVIVDHDRRLDDAQRDLVVEHLAATPEEALATMAPIGRVLAGTQ